MRKISAVGLFSIDKFEETPKQKVIELSKFKKNYFKNNTSGAIPIFQYFGQFVLPIADHKLYGINDAWYINVYM